MCVCVHLTTVALNIQNVYYCRRPISVQSEHSVHRVRVLGVVQCVYYIQLSVHGVLIMDLTTKVCNLRYIFIMHLHQVVSTMSVMCGYKLLFSDFVGGRRPQSASMFFFFLPWRKCTERYFLLSGVYHPPKLRSRNFFFFTQYIISRRGSRQCSQSYFVYRYIWPAFEIQYTLFEELLWT